MLKAMGWSIDGGACEEEKAVILGVPHTSFWDFVVSYLFYTSLGAGPAKCMIKKELFVGPLGWLLRKLGGIPVDRTNATSLVMSIVTEMRKSDHFILAIAPEGTRKATRRWKTGYHLIAKEVGCPLYLGYFDWGTKHISAGKKFPLTDDAKADTLRIQAEYEKMNLKGKNPGCYITH